MPPRLTMTEHDDTLIDMSDIDDKLDDETETSSSEIDERVAATSSGLSHQRDSNCTSTENLCNNNDSNNDNNNNKDGAQLSAKLAAANSCANPLTKAAKQSDPYSVTPLGGAGIKNNEGGSEYNQELSEKSVVDSSAIADGNTSVHLAEQSATGSSGPQNTADTDSAGQTFGFAETRQTYLSAVHFEGKDIDSDRNAHGPSEISQKDYEITELTKFGGTDRQEDNTISDFTSERTTFKTDCAVTVSEPTLPKTEALGGEEGSQVTEDQVLVLDPPIRVSASLLQPSSSELDLVRAPEDINEPLAEENQRRSFQEQVESGETRRGISNTNQSRFAELEETHNADSAVTSVTTHVSNDNVESTVPSSSDTTPIPESNCVPESVSQVDMGENAKVEEKLRQFEDNKKGESEDTRGTYNGSTSNLSDVEKQRRRNLIFDEERFEETFLKCLICREVYNDTDKLPKMLHCHHTFCMDCLYQMYRVEGEFRQSLTGVFRHGMPMTVKIQCPTCREGIIISESELRRLPNDHTIMELLCFVSQTGKNEVQYCTKHQMQPLNFFCEPCIMPVCCDCTVIDHKESKGHIVVNVDEAMKKYTPIVEQTLSDIRQEKSNIIDKRASLEAAQDDLDRIQKDLARQVRSVFDSIREILDEREKELYDASEAEIERKRETLEGHIKTLAERDAMLNTEFNELQKAKDDKDISLIFTGHKSAREALAKKVYVPTNSTKGFSVTFQFSSRADSVIKQNVANLGDIIFQS